MPSKFEGIEGTEVIVSHVTSSPNTSLPKHWHPSEQFACVLEDSFTLWQNGKPDTVCKKGEVVTVPLKHIHTSITAEEGVALLTFRVHEEGKSVRVKAD